MLIGTTLIRMSFFSLLIAVVAPQLALAATEIRAKSSDQCVDAPAGHQTNGLAMIQWTCHQESNQQWNIINRGGGYYSFQNVATGKCLDWGSASPKEGDRLIQWGCWDGINQKFYVARTQSGDYTVQSHNNLCMDIARDSRQQGTQIIAYGCHGRDNQKYQISLTGQPSKSGGFPFADQFAPIPWLIKGDEPWKTQ